MDRKVTVQEAMEPDWRLRYRKPGVLQDPREDFDVLISPKGKLSEKNRLLFEGFSNNRKLAKLVNE